MRLDQELGRTLGTIPKKRDKAEDFYLFSPFIFDALFGFLLAVLYLLIDAFVVPFADVDTDNIKDILNELISSSFSAGGIILAALAIIAGAKLTVPVKPAEKAKSGSELLYNHQAFNVIVGVFVKSCITYVIVFLAFILVRGINIDNGFDFTLAIMLMAIFIMTSALLRCVLILRKVMKVT